MGRFKALNREEWAIVLRKPGFLQDHRASDDDDDDDICLFVCFILTIECRELSFKMVTR